MKQKIILLLLIITAMISLSSFSNKERNFQEPKKVTQDTIKKNAAIADSLGLISNLKLKLHKKNAHASYYHDKFNGRRTASGKKFDNSKYTAAHRKFPFGTKLKITNEISGKSVIVEVIDRGPFTKGREIDLTRKAFMEIAANKGSGSQKVTIEVIQ